VAVAALLLSLLRLAAAQDGTWGVDADGNWSDSDNWVDGTVANGAGSTATFGGNIRATITSF
jgi:hypothetical protein